MYTTERPFHSTRYPTVWPTCGMSRVITRTSSPIMNSSSPISWMSTMPGNIEKWIGNNGGLIVSANTSPTVMSPG